MRHRVERSITGLFGSSNARYIKKLQPQVDAINALEPKYQAMSDAELREQTAEFRRRLAAGQSLDDILIEAFAVCREAGRRWLSMRHYDVQLIGGAVLMRVAEEQAGHRHSVGRDFAAPGGCPQALAIPGGCESCAAMAS